MNQNVQSIGRTFGNDYLMHIVGEKLRDSRITKIELYINSHEKFRPNRKIDFWDDKLSLLFGVPHSIFSLCCGKCLISGSSFLS